MAQTIEAALTDGKPFAFETKIVRPDGRQRTLLARGDVELRSGRAVRAHGTHQDITDRKAMEHRLHYQAEHDPVTGLYNRRRFGEEVDRVLRYASLYGRTGALLIVDIDNFKVVNDSQRHATRDIVLKTLHVKIHKNISYTHFKNGSSAIVRDHVPAMSENRRSVAV